MKIAVALALCVASVQGMALCVINTTLRAERLACECTTSVDASQTHALRPRACARLRVYGRCTVCIMCVELYMWAYTKWCILNLYLYPHLPTVRARAGLVCVVKVTVAASGVVPVVSVPMLRYLQSTHCSSTKCGTTVLPENK